jgi:hypothetical protein
MSELNELIATSASHAYHAGELHERDRIIKLVEAWLDDDEGDLRNVLNLIKNDNKNTKNSG